MKLLSLLLLLLLEMPLFGQQFTDHFTQVYFEQQRFAHRGGYANGPENTLNTILTNIENNCSAIEIDVMLTKDNELVVFHDECIGRILQTTENRAVSEMTLAELKALPLQNTMYGVQYVCSFRELIDTLMILVPAKPDKDFILEVDFKPNGESTNAGVSALMTLVNEHLPIIGDKLYNYFFVTTFYPGVLKALEKADPKMKKGFVVTNVPDKGKFKARLAILLAPHFVKKYSAEVYEPTMCMITENRVNKWHKKGILINAWTANTACEKASLEKHAIAYTTNCPVGNCFPDESDQVGKPKKWCKKCKRN